MNVSKTRNCMAFIHSLSTQKKPIQQPSAGRRSACHSISRNNNQYSVMFLNEFEALKGEGFVHEVAAGLSLKGIHGLSLKGIHGKRYPWETGTRVWRRLRQYTLR